MPWSPSTLCLAPTAVMMMVVVIVIDAAMETLGWLPGAARAALTSVLVSREPVVGAGRCAPSEVLTACRTRRWGASAWLGAP